MNSQAQLSVSHENVQDSGQDNIQLKHLSALFWSAVWLHWRVQHAAYAIGSTSNMMNDLLEEDIALVCLLTAQGGASQKWNSNFLSSQTQTGQNP